MEKKKLLAISELSKYYFYNCDKLIQLMSDKSNDNKIQYKKNNRRTKIYKMKNVNEAMKNRGINFELKVKMN